MCAYVRPSCACVRASARMYVRTYVRIPRAVCVSLGGVK